MNFLKLIYHLLPKAIQFNLKDYKRRRNSIKKYNPNQFENPVFESSIAALDYYKCIFIHIPKNAGLSVCYTLFGNTGGSHRKIVDYKQIFSPNTFKRYYKFTFVRNPWDRVVSTFFFLKNGGITEKDRLWAEKHLAPFTTFQDFTKNWLTEENINNSLHFQHQHIFLEDENGNLAVDFIGRFENIDEDFKKVTAALNMNRVLKKTNTSERKENYRDYFDLETQKIVENVYQKDIQLFNYKF